MYKSNDALLFDSSFDLKLNLKVSQKKKVLYWSVKKFIYVSKCKWKMSAENFSHSRSKLNDKLNIPTFWELIKTIPTIRSEWHLKTPVRHLKKMMLFLWSYLVVILNSFVAFKMVPSIRDRACIVYSNRLSLVQRRSIAFCCGILSVFVLWCVHRFGHLYRFLLFSRWWTYEMFTVHMHSGDFDCGMCVQCWEK